MWCSICGKPIKKPAKVLSGGSIHTGHGASEEVYQPICETCKNKMEN